MKRMPSHGYTIMEVMIFLIVSSALMVSAMSIINSRQERVRFSQTVRGFDEQLKDIMNDVATGFYPTQQNFNCSVSVGGAVTVSTTGVDRDMGTNDGCMYLGRGLRFAPDSDTYDMYTIVANKNANKLSTSSAVLINSAGQPAPDAIKIPADIQVKKIKGLTGGAHPINGFITISEFSNSSDLSKTVTGNASRTGVYEVNGAFSAATLANQTLTPIASNGILICLQQRGGGQQGSIKLGGPQVRQSNTETLVDRWDPECNNP